MKINLHDLFSLSIIFSTSGQFFRTYFKSFITFNFNLISWYTSQCSTQFLCYINGFLQVMKDVIQVSMKTSILTSNSSAAKKHPIPRACAHCNIMMDKEKLISTQAWQISWVFASKYWLTWATFHLFFWKSNYIFSHYTNCMIQCKKKKKKKKIWILASEYYKNYYESWQCHSQQIWSLT